MYSKGSKNGPTATQVSLKLVQGLTWRLLRAFQPSLG